ncbi:HNH endonuclease [Pseudonocardia humida]|uniref:HNH endonuclease n=1 Tax=Pseudonocardia humida TaxID=2800819 RepID=UPI0035562140
MEIHQIPALADLVRTGQPQPAWAQLMTEKRRKTLIVCIPRHDTIHAPIPTTKSTQ